MTDEEWGAIALRLKFAWPSPPLTETSLNAYRAALSDLDPDLIAASIEGPIREDRQTVPPPRAIRARALTGARAVPPLPMPVPTTTAAGASAALISPGGSVAPTAASGAGPRFVVYKSRIVFAATPAPETHANLSYVTPRRRAGNGANIRPNREDGDITVGVLPRQEIHLMQMPPSLRLMSSAAGRPEAHRERNRSGR